MYLDSGQQDCGGFRAISGSSKRPCSAPLWTSTLTFLLSLTGLGQFHILLPSFIGNDRCSLNKEEQRQQMATEERWVGVEDVATHLGVAKDSIYRWIEERGLPAHRVGRLLRFKLSEIDEWVHSGSQSEAGPRARSKRKSPKAGGKRVTQKASSKKNKKAKNG